MNTADLLTPRGLNTSAIPDLAAKKERVLKALHASGVERSELAAVTVLALLDKVPDPARGEMVAPVDGRLADVVRKNLDRTIQLNLAATAMVGAAL